MPISRAELFDCTVAGANAVIVQRKFERSNQIVGVIRKLMFLKRPRFRYAVAELRNIGYRASPAQTTGQTRERGGVIRSRAAGRMAGFRQPDG
jgi:hypothetical protein